MPLFGRKKDEPIISIRSVPKWEEVFNFLAAWFGFEYEMATASSIGQVYGNTVFESILDRPKRFTQLLPSSANVNAHFKDFDSLRLDQLNLYGRSNDQAVDLVGYSDTKVNRKFIDGFVACMNEVYSLLWTDIQAMVHQPFPRKPIPYPIALISDPVTFWIPPYVVRGEQPAADGTYYPGGRGP